MDKLKLKLIGVDTFDPFAGCLCFLFPTPGTAPKGGTGNRAAEGLGVFGDSL